MDKKTKLYSSLENYQLREHTIGKNIIASAPLGLRATDNQIDQFISEGIEMKKDGGNLLIKYSINELPFTFSLRKNSSDLLVFSQIIKNEEYHEIISLFQSNKIPLTNIIDAGANIGLTSIFLKAFFPEAKIIALEPNDANCKTLNKNLSINNYKDIILLKKGLWGHNTYLCADYSFRDGLDWAFRLTETSNKEDASFEVLSVIDIIKQYDLDFIDFLKIDIEGGEASVFSLQSNMEWLKKVRVIALEIHDEFNCRINIQNILTKFGFDLSNSGELTIGINKILLSKTI
jgi:FkbM family methyltransferase